MAYWERDLGTVVTWPVTPLVVPAIDIADGRRCAVDRSSGVPLARAVAASSAIPGLLPPISIDGRRHMDGGLGSQTNADLAVGYDEVVILAAADRDQLAAEVEALKSSGSDVRIIEPCVESAAAMGREPGRLDPA